MGRSNALTWPKIALNSLFKSAHLPALKNNFIEKGVCIAVIQVFEWMGLVD